MAVSKKEIEEEIARLSSFINRQFLNSQQLINKLESYAEKKRSLNQLFDKSKPTLKKQGLQLEILTLKAKLRFLEHLIQRKQQGLDKGGQEEGKKKGG